MERLSNSKATKLYQALDGKLWFNVTEGRFMSNTISQDYVEELEEIILDTEWQINQ